MTDDGRERARETRRRWPSRLAGWLLEPFFRDKRVKASKGYSNDSALVGSRRVFHSRLLLFSL